jgi:PKD repeat protein
VLLLLVVVALDFGRIYLGYINIQNMARIAANHAANNPEAWAVNPDLQVQARYRNQILEDSTASNCALPETPGGEAIIPDPEFSDTNEDGVTTNLGDTVTVRISCSFSVATPILGSILGDAIQVTAESDFPVKAGITAVLNPDIGGGGGGGPVTVPPVSGFVANSSVFATTTSSGTLTLVGPDVDVDFRDASGGGLPTGWAWDFGDGTTSTARDVVHTFECPAPDPMTGYCGFVVGLVASNTYGTSAAAYMTVYVLGETETNFTSNRQVLDAGQSVTFTDASSQAGTDFAWTFGDGETGTGASVTHTYATPGTYTVTLSVTYPDPLPAGSVTKENYITVNVGLCPVPVLKDVRFNDATGIWQGAPYGFTGVVKRGTGANAGNFKIKSQSIAGGSGAFAPCSSDVYVSDLSTVTGP